MKKLFVTLLVALTAMSAAFTAKAIEDPFPKGTMLAGAQVGALPGIGGSLYGDYVLVDSWWKGHFTVGAQLGFRHWKYSDFFTYNDLAIASRATYGLNITEKFEVHAGAILGLGVRTYDGHSQLGLCYGAVTGLRYFFSESLALSAELNYTGYGPYINAGLAFKF